VNCPSRDSVSAGSGSTSSVTAIIVPHSRPSTAIGVATLERIPRTRAISATAPVALDQSSSRTAFRVRSTAATTFSPSRLKRVPNGGGSHGVSDCATRVAVASGSKRSIPTAPLPRFFATSPATAPNTSGGDDSRATSVATRRSAACSSASLSTSALA
jgi:hypothetical protein